MRTRRKLILTIVAGFSAAVLFHTVFISNGWSDRQKLRADLDAVQAENKEIEAEVDRLHSQIDALRRRPSVQERVVRDELGYVKPGDIVLELGARE